MIIASARNSTLAAVLFWAFIGLSVLSFAVVYFWPHASADYLNKIHIKYMMLLVWEAIVGLILFFWYYSSINFSPIEYAKFCIKFVVGIGFVSSAAPFGIAGVELLAVTSNETSTYNLKAAFTS
jgi:hypothetical protein